MLKYDLQTGSCSIITKNISSEKNEEVIQNYKFVNNPIVFENETISFEEIISQEEEKDFYKKAFETKSF